MSPTLIRFVPTLIIVSEILLESLRCTGTVHAKEQGIFINYTIKRTKKNGIILAAYEFAKSNCQEKKGQPRYIHPSYILCLPKDVAEINKQAVKANKFSECFSKVL